MRGSVDQNSALILSLWHCKFAWFFADSTNKYAKMLSRSPMIHKALGSIYHSMKPLRIAIHDHHINNIPEIARHFNCIVLESGIPHAVWMGELHSLMEEVVSISHVLKDYQHRLLVHANDTKSTSTLRDSFDHIHEQPKFTVCLLTLWYWLVVWCFPDSSKPSSNHSINDHLKNEFILAIESHFDMLARCLVNPSPTINKTEQHHLQNLFTMLIRMLKLDLQHWIDALDYFTGKMANAGLLRGQVKKVFNATTALKDDGTMPMLYATETTKKSLVMSAPKFLGKKGWLKNLIRDALIQKIFSEVVDNLEHVVVNVYHGLKDAADFLVEEIPEVVDEVGHEVVDVAKKIVHVVHDQVSHLGHIIADGMHRFAEGVHSVVNKVGHFFSSIF
ncbi:uncharacterized protein LOC110723582 [Chenopodium quinoa]|uniref:uncharacterized protein LOC110723582 n=1 Tax=Chenopodium quinoa TaxID=63459 RepID=UPI000B77B8C8|nr:uncharacterized protein LOC110723582 [Chenopodium quinoa]